MFADNHRTRAAFQAVGELLSADGEAVAIPVVGGAAWNLRGMVERATADVDVIARIHQHPDGTPRVGNAD